MQETNRIFSPIPESNIKEFRDGPETVLDPSLRLDGSLHLLLL